MTPLLEFIRDKKAEKARMREERKDARKKREDERRKMREEERKKRKENAEKNFLEMLNEKTKASAAIDDISERSKEEKSKGRESGKVAGSEKERSKGERFKEGKTFYF
jgi:regulator of nonsense transcripts 3